MSLISFEAFCGTTLFTDKFDLLMLFEYSNSCM